MIYGWKSKANYCILNFLILLDGLENFTECFLLISFSQSSMKNWFFKKFAIKCTVNTLGIIKCYTVICKIYFQFTSHAI